MDKTGYDFEIFLFEEISKKDLKDYEKTFNSGIIKIGEWSNNNCYTYPVYKFSHQLLDDFKEEIKKN